MGSKCYTEPFLGASAAVQIREATKSGPLTTFSVYCYWTVKLTSLYFLQVKFCCIEFLISVQGKRETVNQLRDRPWISLLLQSFLLNELINFYLPLKLSDELFKATVDELFQFVWLFCGVGT